jgi:predicted lipoprotein with Yx(FWY)xxD motif
MIAKITKSDGVRDNSRINSREAGTASPKNQGVLGMRTILSVAIAATIVALGSGVALAQSAEPAKVGDTAKGNTLVDPKGMTLYILDRDTTPGKSTCNAQCATNWPPLMASADAKPAGSWTIVVRDDGAKQWAYKGRPLYFWKDDKKAGDILGDGRNNVWHIAAP